MKSEEELSVCAATAYWRAAEELIHWIIDQTRLPAIWPQTQEMGIILRDFCPYNCSYVALAVFP